MTSFKSLLVSAIFLVLPAVSNAQCIRPLIGIPHIENRYEGIGMEFLAHSSDPLMSFFAYKEDYSLTTSGTLHLKFFVPKNTQPCVEARELDDIDQYQMIPDIGKDGLEVGKWYHFSGWRMRDVLQPHSIGAENLGLKITFPNDEVSAPGRMIAPAILYSTQEPLAITSYKLDFTFDEAIDNLTYELHTGSRHYRTCIINTNAPGLCATDQQWQGRRKYTTSGSTRVRVQFSAQGLPADSYITITIFGTLHNRPDQYQIEYSFYNAPFFSSGNTR